MSHLFLLRRPAMRSVSRTVAWTTAIMLALGCVTGCVYRIDIQQGNFLNDEEIDRVAVGMTRVQVRALLGTPMVSDPFESSRWDYVYYLKRGYSSDIERRNFIVFFEGDKVSRIERSDQAKVSQNAEEKASD